MSSGKRKLEQASAEENESALDELRRKRQVNLQALKADAGSSGPPVPTIASSSATDAADDAAAARLPDEADGDQAAYFDSEADAVDPLESTSAANGHSDTTLSTKALHMAGSVM